LQVNISEVGPINVLQSGEALVSSTIQQNSINLILYDGSNFQLLATSYQTNISPTGTIIQFASTTPPVGFIECNGSAISRATYANLFAVIDTTFGVGDGTTTFNVPDMRGYFPRGWDDGAGVDPGRAFGSTQTGALASHTHTITDPGHVHGYLEGSVGSSGSPTTVWSPMGLTAVNTNSATTGITVNATGSTENRPINLAILFAIKI
jgi:microcystin-dependent protein